MSKHETLYCGECGRLLSAVDTKARLGEHELDAIYYDHPRPLCIPWADPFIRSAVATDDVKRWHARMRPMLASQVVQAENRDLEYYPRPETVTWARKALP